MHLSGTILEAITDSMTERILLLSRDCTVLWMNKAAREQAARTADEPAATGRLCELLQMQQAIYSPGACPESCPVATCERSGGQSVITEHTTVDALTNDTRVDEITISPLVQDEKKPEQFLFIARDMTERIRHEKALQETADKLRALDEMKSDFISIASHELRTPITAIKSAIDIIIKKKAGDVTELQNKFLTMAERNINRLSSLINDLLSISKIESGKMTFTFAERDIRAVIENAVMTVGTLASEKSLTLQLDLSPELPVVYVDAAKIEQVILNLVGNAIKFTPSGGTISIDAHIRERLSDMPDDITGFLEIAVTDTGPGIAQEHLPHLFEKFFQAETSLSKQKQPGSGLGLAISKGLVEAHGGTMAYRSTPGKGSTFFFTLPMVNLDKRFHESIRDEMIEARENGTPLSILIFRLVRYASLLDALKRKGCERALEAVTEKILRNGIKTKDLMQSSLHSGEISLLMPDTDSAGVRIVQTRILQLLADLEPAGIANGEKLRFKAGAATFPENGTDPDQLLAAAYSQIGRSA